MSEEEEGKKTKQNRSLLTFPQVGKWDLGFRGGVESRPGHTFVALPSATRSHSWRRRPESALEVGAGGGPGRVRVRARVGVGCILRVGCLGKEGLSARVWKGGEYGRAAS